MIKGNLWLRLQEPINPHLCMIIGVLNIVYGFWALLPNANDPSSVYPYLDFFVPGQFWGGAVLAIGLMLVSVHIWGKPGQLAAPMVANGIIWAVMSGLVLGGDWRANIWILMAGVSIYSIFIAANVRTNFCKNM